MAQQPKKTDEQLHPENYFTSPQGHVRDRILIHESSDIPREGQFISLNGYAFLAKPGEEVDLPRPVRLMLDTRIRTDTVQGEDGKDHHRNIRRINYTIVALGVNIPAPEAIASEEVAATSP